MIEMTEYGKNDNMNDRKMLKECLAVEKNREQLI